MRWLLLAAVVALLATASLGRRLKASSKGSDPRKSAPEFEQDEWTDGSDSDEYYEEEESIEPEEIDEEKYREEEKDLPEEERVKRQVSRQAYMNYINNLRNANYDPRADEAWWVLYPYGKRMLDDRLMGQAGRETQANLAFDCPYYGFRFNYTFVYPMGMVSFARPPFSQPPWTFPNPLWPHQRDHSFIAPFYAEAQFQWIGNTRISNVWFRSIHRPQLDDDEFYSPFNPFINPGGNGPAGPAAPSFGNPNPQSGFNPGSPQNAGGGFGRKKRQMPNNRWNSVGMVVDPTLLNNITRDIQDGYNGANGWRAEHAFMVTWERMAYGGAPKAVDVSQFEQVRQWQNTFQMVIATDEIRTFVIFNYARLNWTTSNEAGGLNGFGGKQAAMAGFNGGNGTGWFPLPYSGWGRIWKLGYFSNVLTPGRWIHRVDEEITPGGCSNGSTGFMVVSPQGGAMQGGIAVNISGPCLRQGDFVKAVFENWPVDCVRVNRIRARCIMPMFHKTGLVPLRMSRDGGASFPYIGWFYVLQPFRARPKVQLWDDVEKPQNRWYQPHPEQLSMQWEYLNLTYNANARVDINLYGYWEDADRSHFQKIDSIALGQANNGRYTFSPRSLIRNPLIEDAWKKYHFGFVQVAISGQEKAGVLWSQPTPFAWYYEPYWQQQYGQNWAMEMCTEWFEYDGRRRNFIMDLTHHSPCPCKLEQALVDLGRYMPFFECDMDGDASCPFNKGAQHCVQTVLPSWTGASQQCCYDYQGFLMFSDDWEPTGDYLRFFNPGTPVRAHSFGAYPYKRPPRIPGLSHYQLDLMPYRMCCTYAEHCEFYYWRRQTNGCQDYRPPGAAYLYGEPHAITFDGTRYTFPGKGYFVALMSEDPEHKLMIQVRLEQPPETLWRSQVNATVVTGIAIQENNSDVVQIFARKQFQRWRYRTDVYVNGIRRFFDKPRWKIQQFNGLSIRNPKRNMNHSELYVMLNSGAGIRVQESFGMLDMAVFLPPEFNSTCSLSNQQSSISSQYGRRRCYVTKGLLGAWNGDRTDDLMNLDGSVVRVPEDTYTASTTQQIYEQFGVKWRVDGANPTIGPVLFQDTQRPINNPLQFASLDYQPMFMPTRVPLNASLIFSMEEVTSACAGAPECTYDYLMMGRREIALTTLYNKNKFTQMQSRGSRLLVSCGPLLKKPGVIKTPPAQNYLDGDVVTFSCKPDWFIHGDAVRRCVNGTWSPGWWVWCRDRYLEYALKWVTGIATILIVIILLTIIFCCCWRRRVRLQREREYEGGAAAAVPEKRPLRMTAEPYRDNGGPTLDYRPAPPEYNGGGGAGGGSSGGFDEFEHEPVRVGLAPASASSNGRGRPPLTVTSA